MLRDWLRVGGGCSNSFCSFVEKKRVPGGFLWAVLREYRLSSILIRAIQFLHNGSRNLVGIVSIKSAPIVSGGFEPTMAALCHQFSS